MLHQLIEVLVLVSVALALDRSLTEAKKESVCSIHLSLLFLLVLFLLLLHHVRRSIENRRDFADECLIVAPPIADVCLRCLRRP